ITPLEGRPGSGGSDKREACIIIRYSGYHFGYCVGMGAWNTKFFVAKMRPNDWQLLASVGKSTSIQYGKSYAVRVEFVGSRIILYENNVQQLSVSDETYAFGQWALRTRKTVAKFSNLDLDISMPRCFVVMPFSTELSFVWD